MATRIAYSIETIFLFGNRKAIIAEVEALTESGTFYGNFFVNISNVLGTLIQDNNFKLLDGLSRKEEKFFRVKSR
jgi:hypothetical protein